nr:hypothetical protein [uncultured Cohaesibacter sp.]
MLPIEAIKASPAEVWLTSFYGFTPELWGFLGFSNPGNRKSFIKEAADGALVVIYGHKSKSPKDMQGYILGVLQVSRRINHAQAFMDPIEWKIKETNADSKGKWNEAVKATRAWRVVPESYVSVDEFADETYSREKAQSMGSLPARLTQKEALKLLDLVLVETPVFGETPIDAASPVLARTLFSPSKAGPISQEGYFCKEAEGPKQNYILKLEGDTSAFLGRPSEGSIIIKVGLSCSPYTRQRAFNASLPAGAFSWALMRSNELDGRPAYPSSKAALAGEAAMKDYLARNGMSLGGEFFLASQDAIADAWKYGIGAAEKGYYD